MNSGEDGRPRLDNSAESQHVLSDTAAQWGNGDEVPFQSIDAALEQVLHEAIKLEATEIHFDPQADRLRVRFRGPGRVLHQAKVLALPPRAVLARIKIRADLDITELRVPQDGVMKMMVGDFIVTAPTVTLPTTRGERAIIIPHVERTEPPLLRERGLPEDLVKLVRSSLRARKGLLVAGGMPHDRQGFLRTLLRDADPQEQLVVFISDDQPRIPDERVVVVIANRNRGGVAGMLRAVARNRADLVILDCMLGTQEMGYAMTHSREAAVLIWLPVMTPAEAVTHLRTSGVEAVDLIDRLSLVITEKRFPRLCPNCRQRVEAGWDASGCDSCIAGRKGEVFVHRMLHANDRLREILRQGGDALNSLSEEEVHCSGSFERNVRALLDAGEVAAKSVEA